MVLIIRDFMNITQLRYFHAVCLYQTVSGAAEYLHISQPSVSNAIRDLEKEFNVMLFKRQRRGMTLTPEGMKLYTASRDFLNRHEQLERMLHDMGKGRKTLRLGIPPMAGSLLLPQVYREFVPQHPDISLKITEQGRYELLEKLGEDLLDMVVLPHTQGFESDLSAVKIADLEVVCCAHRNHPVAVCKSIDAATLENVPLVLFADAFFQTTEILAWFARSEIRPNVLLQTEQLSTAQNIIENNLAVGFMFKLLAEKNPETVSVPLRDPIHISLSLLRKKDIYMSGSMQKFRTYLLERNPFDRYCGNPEDDGT